MTESDPPSSIDLTLLGVRVGHWTDTTALTGCTVVVLPPGTVASGEVRGGAPATREFALLAPERTVAAVDAVLLTGGSAFGLAAAEGVVDGLVADDRGFETRAAKVPIVVGMAIYDLAVGDATVRPGRVEGRSAYEGAEASVVLGPVGGGAGATWGKWRGETGTQTGGIGGCIVERNGLLVAALVVVNAVGDIVDGPVDLEGDWFPDRSEISPDGSDMFGRPGEATTIATVLTNASLDKIGCLLVAQGGHDGFARALFPAHTRGDGDAVVAVATGAIDAGVDLVRALAVLATERAIRSVRPSR